MHIYDTVLQSCILSHDLNNYYNDMTLSCHVMSWCKLFTLRIIRASDCILGKIAHENGFLDCHTTHRIFVISLRLWVLFSYDKYTECRKIQNFFSGYFRNTQTQLRKMVIKNVMRLQPPHRRAFLAKQQKRREKTAQEKARPFPDRRRECYITTSRS